MSARTRIFMHGLLAIICTGASALTAIADVKLTASDGGAGDSFGISVSFSDDVAMVGACNDDDNGIDAGAAYVLCVNSNGTVKAEQEISAAAGGLTEPLGSADEFGRGVSGLGDLNGDGAVDIAVGAPKDGDGPLSGEQEMSAAYIASWKRFLTDDPKALVWAAGKAQKAADLILDACGEASTMEAAA